MLRSIPTSLLLAAFVTSSSALAARTDDSGRKAKPPSQRPVNLRHLPRVRRAQSPLQRR